MKKNRKNILRIVIMAFAFVLMISFGDGKNVEAKTKKKKKETLHKEVVSLWSCIQPE